MTAQHTPGPWSVSIGDFADNGDARYILEGIKTIGLKDARLIAAAPDLLLELDNCLDLLVTCFPDSPDNSRIGVAITKARAAIAKAEGKP